MGGLASGRGGTVVFFAGVEGKPALGVLASGGGDAVTVFSVVEDGVAFGDWVSGRDVIVALFSLVEGMALLTGAAFTSVRLSGFFLLLAGGVEATSSLVGTDFFAAALAGTFAFSLVATIFVLVTIGLVRTLGLPDEGSDFGAAVCRRGDSEVVAFIWGWLTAAATCQAFCSGGAGSIGTCVGVRGGLSLLFRGGLLSALSGWLVCRRHVLSEASGAWSLPGSFLQARTDGSGGKASRSPITGAPSWKLSPR